MLAFARIIIRASAFFAAPLERKRFTEEWLGELPAVSPRGSAATLRFAIGAFPAAWSTREPMRLASAITGDLKYAWRQLIQRPGYAMAVVGCLIIGLVVSI